MLLTIIELRNRMLNVKPNATVSVTFRDDDMVELRWEWVGVVGHPFTHRVVVPLHSITGSNRSFEREMHKAKRSIKNGGYDNGH
jgi:hypothetical protein